MFKDVVINAIEETFDIALDDSGNTFSGANSLKSSVTASIRAKTM
jgi:hypothetical protein